MDSRAPVGLPDRSDIVVIEQSLGGQHLIPQSRAFIRVANLNHSTHESLRGSASESTELAGVNSSETVRHVMIIIAPSNSKSEKQTASGSLRLRFPGQTGCQTRSAYLDQ